MYSIGVSTKKITNFEVGQRLDVAITAAFSEYSRSAHAKLIELGNVKVNAEVKTAKYKLKSNDEITIDLDDLNRSPDEIDLPIIYQDEDIIIIDKPSGVLTHSKGDFNKEGTVATFIQPFLNGDDEWKHSNRAGIVHRLDRGTSGIIVCAKNKVTQDYLQGQFSKRNIKKSYLAVINKTLDETNGMIDVPIERNPKKPSTFRAGINGKPAQTSFELISVKELGSEVYSLLDLKPITGRTHQLRVHLMYLKHPILGDDYYGGKEYSRLMLHARSIEFTMPSSERKIFESEVPKEFKEFMNE